MTLLKIILFLLFYFPYGNAVAETSPAVFYYYCGSVKAYYPAVTSCPEAWVAIPLVSPHGLNYFGETEEPVQTHPWSASIEFYGRALQYSLDFDRSISKHLTLGSGISSWHATSDWSGYQATITVIPIYANFYFTEWQSRGFISLGGDLISASQSRTGDHTFENTGVAAVFGCGYEYRSYSGFLLRVAAFLIVGRSTILSPGIDVGMAF